MVARILTIDAFTMRQTTIKSMFDRAYSSQFEEKNRRAASSTSTNSKQDLPLFYISLGIAIVVYIGLLLVAPSAQRYDDWFATMHNPKLHQDLTAANKSPASRLAH